MLTTPLLAPLGTLDSSARSTQLADASALLFDRLGPLHGLRFRDCELLRRSAVGVAFIHAMGSYSTLEHELFELALADLPAADALVVETAVCLAVDRVALHSGEPRVTSTDEQRRILWLAAMLRFAEAIAGERGILVDDVYAAWTEDVLYIEIDGAISCDETLKRPRSRSAALEAVSGRRLVLTSSARRREAARTPAA